MLNACKSVLLSVLTHSHGQRLHSLISGSIIPHTSCRKNKVLFSAPPAALRQQSDKQTGFKVTPDADAIETFFFFFFFQTAGELKLMRPQT